jgi:hypothetical protein
MTFTYRDAELSNASVFIGLAGPSGSGKTFSALRVAKGLARGKPIYFIDTEARRALHYANQFQFKHGELGAPFSPDRYAEAIKAARAAGAGVIVVDSMSHEHEGEGGVLDMHESELTRMAGDDWGKRDRVKFAAWIKPKQARTKLINLILQLGMHCVFCFRAKEKIALVKDDKGKQVPVQLGWQPIVGDRFEYEMTALLMLPPNSRGVPDLGLSKMQDQFAPFFKPGAQIDENLGERFAVWADGKASTKGATAKTDTATAGAKGETGPHGFPLLVGGATIANHGSAKDFLTSMVYSMKTAGGPAKAVKVWDENADTFRAIFEKAQASGKAAAVKMVNDFGQQAQALMVDATGDLLSGVGE